MKVVFFCTFLTLGQSGEHLPNVHSQIWPNDVAAVKSLWPRKICESVETAQSLGDDNGADVGTRAWISRASLHSTNSSASLHSRLHGTQGGNTQDIA